MKVDVLLGLQWGDEGKGKVVDVLTPKYDIVARFQGGPNAGHTLEFDRKKYVLHTIPSGIFQGDKVNIIGNGVVIDPAIFKKEIEELKADGHEIKSKLFISKKAHLILPTHRLLDAAYEKAKGKDKIGSTLKGIGPTYTDKVSRNGLRVGDIFINFDEKYNRLKQRHIEILKTYLYDYSSELKKYESEWMQGIELISACNVVDSEQFINDNILLKKSVLAEGAQGTLLDIDFGSYPFVTSSNTVCAGACTGLGVAPNKIGEVFGIFKAYCTRVGSGPFPTELFDEAGQMLRDKGHEYGSTTGRPRRCGWLDLVALKYSVMINGVTQLIMMKSDVMDAFETIKIAVAYEENGQEINYFPYELTDDIKPVFKEFHGWKTDMTKMTDESQFPVQFSEYLAFIEKYVGVPVNIVSVGPDRSQTIVRQ
ncbi:adenylosuccinate synthase [Saccharicrinis sp. FJH62]|uniref:adenylosuccinate synthase n=1 Tax=Saccharicrinis sp. FJH62 TaxID=3344657 RepID=UPI0035D489F6